MATLEIPAYGYGIRYVHGLFRQRIDDGWQVELPEDWLAHGNPWEFERRESAYEIGFGGHVEPIDLPGQGGCATSGGRPSTSAVAFDTPIVGWRGARVNTLRLWSAQPIDPILLDTFNSGDHIGALPRKARGPRSHYAGSLSRRFDAGRQELRLRQEFFFSSASLQDIVRRHLQQYGDMGSLPDKVAIQLNDTHPAIAVAELMRLLIDVHGLDWATAWELTAGTFGYTNHTLLPEALETWPVALFERLLPRHMQIIYAINRRFLAEARTRQLRGRADRQRVSLIDEGGERRVRMAHLAFVGTHSVNGVSALHTELMKKTVFSDLNALYPDRINNKTNGITPRRWLLQCNPGPDGADHRAHRRPASRRPRPAPPARRPCRRSGLPGAVRRGQARQQGSGSPKSSRTRVGIAVDPRRCSTCRSSASTNTSASCSTSSRRWRSTTPSAPTGTRLGAARQDFRRQGGARLLPSPS